MTSVQVQVEPPQVVTQEANGARVASGRGPRDLQRTFQLVLATVWLLDAVLQLQPFMFTRGPNGFSGMLNGLASGNPGWIAHTITWNGSIVYHEPILTNALFAGDPVPHRLRDRVEAHHSSPPSALSIVWSLGVWWFGEGAGRDLQGGATPFGGGPGGVLFYALLAVLLWPSEGSDRPFVAARTIGVAGGQGRLGGTWGPPRPPVPGRIRPLSRRRSTTSWPA